MKYSVWCYRGGWEPNPRYRGVSRWKAYYVAWKATRRSANDYVRIDCTLEGTRGPRSAPGNQVQ